MGEYGGLQATVLGGSINRGIRNVDHTYTYAAI